MKIITLRLLVVSLLLLVASTMAKAQAPQYVCYSDQLRAKYLQENPEVVQAEEAVELIYREYIRNKPAGPQTRVVRPFPV